MSRDYLLGDTPRKIEFTEPLESYAAWLRKVGMPISGVSKTGMVVAEVENEEFHEIVG